MSTMPKPKAAASDGNPAFNMMGLPKIHTWKMPSRNWSIFWAVLGSFGATIAYDRYEKRQIIARYKSQVAHLADAPLQPLEMPRKVNIYMGAPPGDTIHIAREHFVEYIKPILNAAAIDFELIEGVMQGNIRHKVAQAIRDKRRGVDNLTELQRAAKEKLEYDQEAGNIILGRHTYKEYLRGLHEGYLGPTEEPEDITAIMNPRMPGDPITEASDVVDVPPSDQLDDSSTLESPNVAAAAPNPTTAAKTEEEVKAEVDAIKAKIPSSPPSYIVPSDYATAQCTMNETIDQVYVPMQHLLGFLNTPWRIYRFLTRRHLAEDMCSRTAAAVLASDLRPFEESSDPSEGQEEELDWPKKNRTKEDGVWVEPIALDRRVTEHIRIYTSPKDLQPATRTADSL